MAEKKKLEAKGLELHQNMMLAFSDRFDSPAFARGFESSTDPEVSQRSDSLVADDAQKTPFEEVMKMKSRVVFDTQKTSINVEMDKEPLLARTRTLHLKPGQSNNTSMRPSEIGSPTLQPSEIDDS